MQFLLFLALLPAPENSIEKKFFLDYSSGGQKTNVEVTKKDAVFNTREKKSLVFFRPGRSEITAKFQIPVKPAKATLELEHLSSGAAVKFGGTSRITILINGDPLVKEWEVGSHSHSIDRLHVGKMLRPGENVVQVRFHSGKTTYWMKRLQVTCTFPVHHTPRQRTRPTWNRTLHNMMNRELS